MVMLKTQTETYSEGSLEVFDCVISEDGTERPRKPAQPKKPAHRKPVVNKRRRPKEKSQ